MVHKWGFNENHFRAQGHDLQTLYRVLFMSFVKVILLPFPGLSLKNFKPTRQVLSKYDAAA